MRSHQKKNLTNLGNFEYQNEHVDSGRFEKPRFAWGKARKLSTLVLLSTVVRTIVYRPFVQNMKHRDRKSRFLRFPPTTANPSLSLAERPQGHFGHVFVSEFSQDSPSDAVNPEKGGGVKKGVRSRIP